MRRLLPLAIALLAVLPAALAAAADGTVADVQTSRLDAPAAATLGALAAFEEKNGTAPFAFGGTVVEVTVEEERGEAYAEVPRPGSYVAQPPRQETHEDVEGGRVDLRALHKVHVFPLAGADAPRAEPDSRCAALVPSARDEVHPHPIKNGTAKARHPERADTRATLAWDPGACPASGWRLTGSFTVALYEADATIGSTTYASGHREEGQGTVPMSPGAINATEVRVDRYVYLTIRDGWLSTGAGSPEVFLSSAEVRAAAVALADARGTVPALGDARLAGDRVELAGDLLAAARHGGVGAGTGAATLAVHVTGRLDAGSIGGRSVAVASGGNPAPSGWMAALLALPVLAGGCAAVAWRGGPARRLARLDRLGLAGRHDQVAARSRRLRRHADLGAEASAMRIEALALSGRAAEALAEAEQLGGFEGGLAAAYVHALAGEAERAVEALRPWQPVDPERLGFALRQPAFAAVRRHPEAARWAQAPAQGANGAQAAQGAQGAQGARGARGAAP